MMMKDLTLYYSCATNPSRSQRPAAVKPLRPYGPAPQNPESNNTQDPQDRVTGNQIANSENFYANFAQQYSDAVIEAGAIVPLWEAETARQQAQAGNTRAGATSEQIAFAERTSYAQYVGYDQWYGTPGDARWSSQQTFTVIALDLNGDGVITTTKKESGNGVLFDVDNDGIKSETIATPAFSTQASSRFGLKAGNDGIWGVAA